MKNIVTIIALFNLITLSAQYTENFYKGEKGKKVKLTGTQIDIITCASDSFATLTLSNDRQVQTENRRFQGSCPEPNDVVLNDEGVLKVRFAQFQDTLFVDQFGGNGRRGYQKTIAKANVSRFQKNMIPYGRSGFAVATISYPTNANGLAKVGFLIFDRNGIETAQITVDSLVDLSPNALLLEGSTDTEFYILQSTNTECGKFKLHKIVGTNKVWTKNLNYGQSCDNMQLQSFAINETKDRVGLLFLGTTGTTFNKYFLLNSLNGTLMPTNFDLSTAVHYNTKTAFGKDNDVFFVRVIDFNTVISPVPNRTALEIVQFSPNQRLQQRKRYLETQNRVTDTIPTLEDAVVANDSTVYVLGSRIRKTWLLSDRGRSLNSTIGGSESLRVRNTITSVMQDFNSSQIIVEVNSIDNQEVVLGFYNNLGRMVKSVKTPVVQGTNYIPVDLGSASKGLIVVHLNNVVTSGAYKFVKM
jgi:hypothetical protein